MSLLAGGPTLYVVSRRWVELHGSAPSIKLRVVMTLRYVCTVSASMTMPASYRPSIMLRRMCEAHLLGRIVNQMVSENKYKPSFLKAVEEGLCHC